jgi:limonene-1,2-epoxide hydrolase
VPSAPPVRSPTPRSPRPDDRDTPRGFRAAWSAFFTEDAVYHNIPQAPVTGKEAIADTIESVLRLGPPERVDVFTLPAKSFELQVMGTFEVSGDTIST